MGTNGLPRKTKGRKMSWEAHAGATESQAKARLTKPDHYVPVSQHEQQEAELQTREENLISTFQRSWLKWISVFGIWQAHPEKGRQNSLRPR